MNDSQDTRLQELVDLARQAARQAYAPESGFSVGAAIRAASGAVYSGCNVENASFGVSICAERAALFAAVTAGEREFTALAVAAGLDGREDAPPCGACRQALVEFSPDMMITYRSGGADVTRPLRELLPDPFLRKDGQRG